MTGPAPTHGPYHGERCWFSRLVTSVSIADSICLQLQAYPFRLGVPERDGEDGQVLLLAAVAGVRQRARKSPPREAQRLRGQSASACATHWEGRGHQSCSCATGYNHDAGESQFERYLSSQGKEKKGEEFTSVLLLIWRADILPATSPALCPDISNHVHAYAHHTAKAADKLLGYDSLQLLLVASVHI